MNSAASAGFLALVVWFAVFAATLLILRACT
jgi:hypothetical protein